MQPTTQHQIPFINVQNNWIIGYNFNTIPVPTSQEKELSCRQSFSSKLFQNITILHIFYQNFSGWRSTRPPPPSIQYKSISPPYVIVKQSQKLTSKRCMAPHFSLLSPSFFFILLFNVETVKGRTFIYLACTYHFNHLVSVTAGWPEFLRGHM